MHRFYSAFLFIGIAIVFLSSTSEKARPLHLFLAGDSTMADKVLYKYAADPQTGGQIPVAFPERGWGMLLPEFFTDKAVIENYAKNGRSTRTFIEEGLWAQLISNLQKGDYVVIQFGHNDASEAKTGRYTPPSDYKKNLVKFIDETRAKGGNPILCTPVARRKYEKGKIVNTHGVYPDLVKEVAKAKNVPVADMYSYTEQWLNEAGEENSAMFFMNIPAGVNTLYPGGLTDNTHYVEEGARKAAAFFVEDIEKQHIEPLAQLLKKNEKAYISKVWVADLGNGTYKNPILHADYSDPDVCRVGDDYYMTASGFNCVPGLPVLHSKDMVNWTLAGHALQRLPPENVFSTVQHGKGVWAPAIRYHNGEFYIYYGDPDVGIYMTKTKNPVGEWEPPVLVKEGKGLIDACPFWDDDNQAYLAHAYAGSRAGIKSVLSVTRLTPDGKKAAGPSKIVYDGHGVDETIEGPKLYKRNGYYYIFAPAGGVATGWQLVLRSKNIWGPYERKVVMAQGNTAVNGPHQGAWVDTKTGEDWFFHFQDASAFGRVVHLQPMKWEHDWPVIGVDKDGGGCGEPVLTYRKPNVGAQYPVATPVESDEFDSGQLGLQWQWHANPMDWWHYCNSAEGVLTLYAVPVPDGYKSLWDVPNLLLQKMPAAAFTATTKLTFDPNPDMTGEKAGLVVMGSDYASLSIESTQNGFALSQNECKKAGEGGLEKSNASVEIKENTFYLRVQIQPDATCLFSYSTDGKKFQNIGRKSTFKEGKWIGAKVGLFCTRPISSNDGGRMVVDWFSIDK
jgi:beta-xylosidase/lysophospholipase L1-like esterase